MSQMLLFYRTDIFQYSAWFPSMHKNQYILITWYIGFKNTPYDIFGVIEIIRFFVFPTVPNSSMG